MTKRKANVTPADVGTIYLDSEGGIYRLLRCDTEPLALMRMVYHDETQLEKPISEFANFVRLRPEHPIVKPPAPRKPRSDKGSHRKLTPEQIAERLAEQMSDEKLAKIPNPLDTLPLKKADGKKIKWTRGLTSPDISTFTIRSPEPGMPDISILTIGETAVACKTLKEGAAELMGALGIDQTFVESQPESEGKKNLLSILREGG